MKKKPIASGILDDDEMTKRAVRRLERGAQIVVTGTKQTQCTHCGVKSNQPPGDGCHNCLKGVMK